MKLKPTSLALAIAATVALAGVAIASSHREAPLITKSPKVDNTDLYMFRSYETDRAGYVTFLANFQPLQDPTGGPNFFLMDEDALYGIHVDNDGDAQADISYYFRFHNSLQNLAVPVDQVSIPIPLSNIGPFGNDPAQDGNRNVIESYNVVSVRDNRRDDAAEHHRDDAARRYRVDVAKNLSQGGPNFPKPFDNIGNKSIPDYASYADKHIQRIGLEGCASEGRVFVGQRKEGFAIAVGKVFDLLNLDPVGAPDANHNDLDAKNVTTIALEVPIACLTKVGDPIIGAWSTASMADHGRGRGRGRLNQVSRLSAPLVNEIIIGLPDKDKFNASAPSNDAQFAKYVTNPSLPALIQALFPSVTAPTKFPRTDLVAAFLTGVDGLNKPAKVKPAEMMRLNTSIAPKQAGAQATLGVLAGDTAGFPNGRRPGDDVVDIELRVAMGVLLPLADAPSGQLPYTDGVALSATEFRSTFPYLNTPLPGAVN